MNDIINRIKKLIVTVEWGGKVRLVNKVWDSLCEEERDLIGDDVGWNTPQECYMPITHHEYFLVYSQIIKEFKEAQRKDDLEADKKWNTLCFEYDCVAS